MRISLQNERVIYKVFQKSYGGKKTHISGLLNIGSFGNEISSPSDQALEDKKFDPSTIVDLMKLFEIESYKAWAAMELEQEKQVKEIETSMQQAEDYLDSVMEEAMDEFRRFEEEMEDMCKAELKGLKDTAVKARKMGNLMEKAATVASKKYMQAALNSASATAKSAWKGLSSKKPCQVEDLVGKMLHQAWALLITPMIPFWSCKGRKFIAM
ncbi:hypothetical protein HRI_004234300 [Hibiscus trionum]|uniref:Uncharacterized protein n=1 Tax=Hibiscus trionum TaxID=183268 RepID=A0A9W7MQH2_HIBTR|nr:hypothetical protein HRI_004234300 [Hibiscus trionum]